MNWAFKTHDITSQSTTRGWKIESAICREQIWYFKSWMKNDYDISSLVRNRTPISMIKSLPSSDVYSCRDMERLLEGLK